MSRIFTCIICFVVLFSSCKSEEENNPKTEAVNTIGYAKGFSINHLENGDIELTLNENGQMAEKVFVLSTNTNIASPNTIQVPVNRIACQSTTHTAFLSELDANELIKGLAYAEYLKNEELLDLLGQGEIIDLSTSEEIDFELLVGIEADILFVYPYGDNSFEKFKQAGITCFPISEYLEESPLGQAEWIKVFGLLTGKYEESVKAFEELESRYLQNKELAEEFIKEENRKSVFTGSFWKGNWKAPSGKSLIAQYINDAGGVYVFDDFQKTGNIELDFEEFIAKALDAEYFGKVVYEGDSITKDILIDQDERLKSLHSYQSGQMFYCNSEETEYFESGVLDSDIILKDLINILWQPEQLEENQYFHLCHE